MSPIEGTAAAGHAASRLLHLFATNDYLGLSTHPAVRATAAAVAAAHGCGPRASALVCGHTPQHRELERELAALKQAEAALLFPTGYAANLAVLGALADSSECAIFSDALNHASLVDGARLAARGAGAALHVYRHGDLTQLRALLRGFCARHGRPYRQGLNEVAAPFAALGVAAGDERAAADAFGVCIFVRQK